MKSVLLIKLLFIPTTQNYLTFFSNPTHSIFLHSLLHGTEFYTDDELSLGGHVLEHISFESSEHVWSQHVMEFLYLVFFSNISKFFQEALQVAKGDGEYVTVVLDDQMGY